MYYKAFHVNALANVTTLDAGLVSPLGNPVHVSAVIINSSATEGNVIECWIGTKRVAEIYDYCLDTQEEAVGFTGFSVTKIGRLPINIDVPAGQIFRIGSRCGVAGHHIYGAYEYTEGAA